MISWKRGVSSGAYWQDNLCRGIIRPGTSGIGSRSTPRNQLGTHNLGHIIAVRPSVCVTAGILITPVFGSLLNVTAAAA